MPTSILVEIANKYHEYVLLFRTIQKKLLYKISLYIWSITAFYDQLLSQFIPETFSRKFPKSWEVAIMTGGLLPFWVWLLILAAILVIASFEHTIRSGRSIQSKGELPKEQIDILHLLFREGEQLTFQIAQSLNMEDKEEIVKYHLQDLSKRGLVSEIGWPVSGLLGQSSWRETKNGKKLFDRK